MSDNQNQSDGSAPGVTEDNSIETGIPNTPNVPALAVQPSQGVSFGMVVIIAFMASAITVAVMLISYDHFVAKKFLSVDIKGYVQEQQDLFVAGKITEDQLKQNYGALKSVIEKIPRNRVVLMGDAVLGGAEKIDLSSITGSTPAK